jgi:hypothetical protein
VHFPLNLEKDTVELVTDLLQQIGHTEPEHAAIKQYICDEITKQISPDAALSNDQGDQQLLTQQAAELAELEQRHQVMICWSSSKFQCHKICWFA